MKNIQIALTTLGLIFLFSCAEKTDNRVTLKINILAGQDPLVYNTDYTVNGYTVQFTQARFYISQPVLHISGGEDMEFKDTYFLADAEGDNQLDLGNIGAKTIEGISFGFGVDSSRNDITGALAIPAYEYPVDHPLSPARNMYWSWNPGYIWMKLEGKQDVNADGDFEDAGETFSIHTGVRQAYRMVNRNCSFTMDGEPRTFQVDADVLEFFTGYDLVTTPNAHPLDPMSHDYGYMLIIQENSDLVFGNFYE